MGGFNSGRRGGKKTTNDMRPLDVRRLKREGLLAPGHSFRWNWTHGNETVSSINLRVDVGSVQLNYRQHWRGDEWRTYSNTLLIDWTPCNYGGQRAWWRCPIPGCGKRVAVLYSGKGVYACRHCHGLAYRSQRETTAQLATRRANKVRDCLGWDRGILNMPGGRPKGMHRKTYLRLIAEHTKQITTAMSEFGRKLDAVTKRLRHIG